MASIINNSGAAFLCVKIAEHGGESAIQITEILYVRDEINSDSLPDVGGKLYRKDSPYVDPEIAEDFIIFYSNSAKSPSIYGILPVISGRVVSILNDEGGVPTIEEFREYLSNKFGS
jgi:hypothetical protein